MYKSRGYCAIFQLFGAASTVKEEIFSLVKKFVFFQSKPFVWSLFLTTEFFVFQQSFYWTRRFDPETRAFFGIRLLEDEELCWWKSSYFSNQEPFCEKSLFFVFHTRIRISLMQTSYAKYYEENDLVRNISFIKLSKLNSIHMKMSSVLQYSSAAYAMFAKPVKADWNM